MKPGGGEKALQSEAKILADEIDERLRKKPNEDNYAEYEALAKKMERIEVVEQIDN